MKTFGIRPRLFPRAHLIRRDVAGSYWEACCFFGEENGEVALDCVEKVRLINEPLGTSKVGTEFLMTKECHSM